MAARRDGQPVCSRCWQRERRVPQPCSVCGRTMKATKNTPQGRVCYTCHRKTLPRKPCWVCGKTVLAAAHTEEGAWCERCRQAHLAEPCSRCGRTAPVAIRDEQRPVCKACYQRAHQRPPRRCVDCGEDKPAARLTDEGPLCERCDNRRAPKVLCPRCGKTRKVGTVRTGVCRACAQRAIPRQPCRNCGRTRLVAYRDADGEPWCDRCRRRAQAEPCSGCGARKVVCARDHIGPWCTACWEVVRPGPPCDDCGQRPSMPMPGADGVARCVPCHLAAQVPCARCGTTARAERHWPEGPVCLSCVDAVRLTHERCHRCGELAGVFRREAAGPLCPDCAGVTFSYHCPTCGAMGRLLRGQCPSCTARRDLGEVFTQPDGRPAAWLAPLAELLENYDNPYSLSLYLRRPGGQLIRRMVTGELACTHQALDELRQTTAVQHLRGLLVLAELLEPREEELAQLTRDVQTLLERVTTPHDKTILARYARWHLMPLAHQHAEQDAGFTYYQREHLRRKLDTARLLLSYLGTRGTSLATLTQPVADRWLIRNRPRQHHARSFLLWAATNGLAPAHIAIGTSRHTGDREIMSDTDRVLLAVTLETDDTLPLADRVAGCLVLQYGQSCWRLVNLTADDVLAHPDEPGILGLRLGRDPLWLRPRLSALLHRLVTNRRPLAGALRHRPTPYLFPGLRPDRPITSATLQTRLRKLGVPSVRTARNGAWLSLVGAVHWKMLADLLGVADTTASAWHRENGGDRASYVASRLRQGQRTAGPE
ncbi:hypothetical protein HFP15_41330 [Amycolatopsis sp. K13G38]|uniref:Uncharacterized protein n=2 Tax=Pseudonocardiaceae TaxID=2070 RepID=A0ABX1JK61_9PSEU|nr:hypothetical protein [Amycolatopsis acididurans]NKQ59300.1 hypothetical protein [Amycolatopsis acididurans]